MRLRILALAALLAAPAGAGTVLGPSKCDAAKFKAGGAYAQGLAACRSKAAKQGVPVDAACETKALAKLQKAFANAEKKDDCTVEGNAALVATQAETWVADLSEALSQPPICCNLAVGGADNRCGWTLGAAACTARGGAVGAAGTECHGVGELRDAAGRDRRVLRERRRVRGGVDQSADLHGRGRRLRRRGALRVGRAVPGAAVAGRDS